MEGGVPSPELVAGGEAGDPRGRCERDCRSDLHLAGAIAYRLQQSFQGVGRMFAEHRLDQLAPAAPTAAARVPSRDRARSSSNACSSRATTSTGLRHEFASSMRSATASCAGSDASTASARSQPARSRASSALFTKSRVCPPSRYRWSVAAAKRVSAISRGAAPPRGCRGERPLRAFCVADLDEPPEPRAQPVRAGRCSGQRIERKPRRPHHGVLGDVRQSLVQREWAVGRVESR